MDQKDLRIPSLLVVSTSYIVVVVGLRRRRSDTFFFVSSGFRKAQTSRQLSHATGGPYFFSEWTHLQKRKESKL